MTNVIKFDKYNTVYRVRKENLLAMASELNPNDKYERELISKLSDWIGICDKILWKGVK